MQTQAWGVQKISTGACCFVYEGVAQEVHFYTYWRARKELAPCWSLGGQTGALVLAELQW